MTLRLPISRKLGRCLLPTLLLLLAGLGGKASATTNLWTSNGPFSAVVNTVIFSKQALPNSILAGTNGGGIYISADDGVTWGSNNNGISTSAIVNALIACATNSTIYAGTNGSGTYVSTNYGSTWSSISTGLPPNSNVTSLAINGGAGTDLYVGINGSGIYKTTNSGTSWISRNGTGLNSVNIRSVAVFPAAGTTILAGTVGGGLFYSTNDGVSWTAATGLPAGATINSLALDDPDTPVNIFAGTVGAGVYTSADGGASWSAAKTGIDTATIQGLLYKSPNLYAQTDGGLYYSSNNGGSWNALSTGLVTSNVNAMTIDPNAAAKMYLGTSGGIYKSTNSGSNWAASNSGLLYITDVRATAIDPSNATYIYAGGSGSGAFKSTDSGSTWSIANSGLGNATVNALLARPAAIYAGSSNGIYKTTDGAVTWSPVNTGLPIVDVRALAFDPLTSTLYAGTSNGVYKTAEGAINWSSVNTGLSNPDVRALAIDSSAASAVVYAGTAGSGTFKSTNNGLSWSAVNTGFTNTTMYALAADSNNPANVYGGTANGLFKTTDLGSTWNSVSSSFANADIRSLAVATDPLFVFAGTNGAGLYLSSTAAGSWLAVNNGLPASPVVQSISVDSGVPKKLYAGLQNKGASAITISPTIATGGVSSINYGTIFKNSASSQSVTISNNGTIPLNITAFPFTGTDNTLFDTAPGGGNPCTALPISILPSQSCTMAVTFRPTSTGTKTATFHISSDDASSPDTQLSLQGNSISLSATIGSPADGAYLYGSSSFTISGTASASGTTLTRVEVSINGGGWTSATGTTSWSYTWPVPADGTYTIQARAVDPGNYNSTPDCTSRLDCISAIVNNVLPVSAITAPLNNAILTGGAHLITGTASDAGAGVKTVQISTDGGSTWNTAIGTTSWSYNWTPPLSGSYNIQSLVTDNDNKVQAIPDIINVTVDSVPPDSVITAPASAALINGTGYTIRGTASDSGGSGLKLVEISLDGEATWQAVTGLSPWSYSWTFPANTFSPYTIKSRSTDNAGNVQTTPNSVTVTVDNIPPTSTIDAPSQYIKGASYSFGGTASDTGVGLQKVQVSVNGAAWVDATGTTTWSYNWTVPTDGTYTLRSQALDSAGNVQTTPPSVTVIVNNLPPNISIAEPANNASINTSTYAINGTATDAGAGIQKVEVSIDGGAWKPAVVDALNGTWSYAWTIPAQERVYTIQARATDNQGDTQLTPTISVMVDVTAPVSAITAPLSGARVNGTTYTITGTASDPQTPAGPGSGLQSVQISLDGGNTWYPASTTTNWSSWSYNWTLPSVQTHFTLKSRSIDMAGNVQTLPFAADVDVYQVAPDSAITFPSPGAHIKGTSATITGTAVDYGLGVQKVEISTDGGTTWNLATGTDTWSYSWQLPVDGTYTIQSKATDIAGYVQTALGTISLTVDNTLPDTTITSKPALYSNTASPSFAFTANEASSFECSLDSAAYAACTNPQGYSGLAEGSHTFMVRAVDLAGNIDATPASYTWIVDTINPLVTGTVPADQAARISVGIPVTVTFNEAMDPATITGSTFTLNNGTTNATGTVSYDAATRTASFSAIPSLSYATDYTATIGTGAKDLAGNPLAAPLTWTFSTDPDGDLDLNGVVDIADAVLCLKYAVKHTTPTAQQLRHGDVAPLKNGKPNPDGTLNIGDAVVILERVVGLVNW